MIRLRNLELKIKNLKKEINKTLKKEEEIFHQIQTELKDEIIVDTKVYAMIFGQPRIIIEIKPKSAWSFVISLDIYKRTEEFRTSAGGWDDHKNALFEVNYITTKLIKFLKTFDRNIIDKIVELEERVRKLQMKCEQMIQTYNLEKTIQEHNYKKINIEDYFNSIKNGKILECYSFNGQQMKKEKIWFHKNRFRLNNYIISKKALLNYFNNNCYIKN